MKHVVWQKSMSDRANKSSSFCSDSIRVSKHFSVVSSIRNNRGPLQHMAKFYIIQEIYYKSYLLQSNLINLFGFATQCMRYQNMNRKCFVYILFPSCGFFKRNHNIFLHWLKGFYCFYITSFIRLNKLTPLSYLIFEALLFNLLADRDFMMIRVPKQSKTSASLLMTSHV